MSHVSSQVWVVKIVDVGDVTVSLPSFRQVIEDPAGLQGSPVPLDDGVLHIQTQSGIATLNELEILSGEKTDEGFRVRTSHGQFIGVPQMTQISHLVITGLVDGKVAKIDFGIVESFRPV